MPLNDPHQEGLSSVARSSRQPGSALPIHEDEATLEAIARFDELESHRLDEISSNPAARQILDRLREVDRWLESAVAENNGGGVQSSRTQNSEAQNSEAQNSEAQNSEAQSS